MDDGQSVSASTNCPAKAGLDDDQYGEHRAADDQIAARSKADNRDDGSRHRQDDGKVGADAVDVDDIPARRNPVVTDHSRVNGRLTGRVAANSRRIGRW